MIGFTKTEEKTVQKKRTRKPRNLKIQEDKVKLLKELLRIPGRVLVNSSNIRSIGFLPCGKDIGTLEVEFNNGSVYHYLNVPEYKHEELMSASSHGRYLIKNIKGCYSSRKIS